MKFIRITLSFNLKAMLLLTLLLSNILVSANETIKLNKSLNRLERKLSTHKSTKAKTNRKSTKVTTRRALNKNKGLNFEENLKAFLLGYVAAVVVKILKKDEGVIMQSVARAVDWCFEPTFNEYTAIKKEIMDKNRPPEVGFAISKVLGEEEKEIRSKCARLETINKADSNEYSSLNVLLKKVKGVFVDESEFEAKYKAFKEEKEKLNTLNASWTEKYKPLFEKAKNSRIGRGVELTQKGAEIVYDSMSGIFFKKDLCEVINEGTEFSFWDFLKTTVLVSMNMLKCAATAQLKDPLWYGFQGAIEGILKELGLGIVGKAAGAIFPGVLLGLLIKFVISNWSALKQFVDSFLTLKSDDPSTWNAERDLWNSIGRLIAGALFAIVGVKKRKLKKFRKFDEKLY